MHRYQSQYVRMIRMDESFVEESSLVECQTMSARKFLLSFRRSLLPAASS